MAEHNRTSIVWVDGADPGAAVAAAGSKMGRLAELHAVGVVVPRGYAITLDAYRRHCAESGLDPRIEDVIARLGTEPSDGQVEAASAEIRGLVESTPIAVGLAEEITAAYEELCLRCVDVNVPTAVRSSATGEDAADASFAGIFDTYLGVAGIDRVLDAVRRCWGSLFTGRALAYRLRKDISHHSMPIAVGVIELIHARASGVAFSVQPVTGKPDRIVVETNWGWGEAVVQGLVDPDHVEIGKADGRILKYNVAHKKIVSAFDFATGRVTEIDMPANLADRRVLDDEQIAAIAQAVTSIEQHYGYPVDVEWVISRHRRAGDPVCIVQSRPVTVTAPTAVATAYDPLRWLRSTGSAASRSPAVEPCPSSPFATAERLACVTVLTADSVPPRCDPLRNPPISSPTVVPIDEYATGEWYPGYKPEHFATPYLVDPASPFKPGDEQSFWFLDFHWSRGLTPLAATMWASDGYCWGTQHAAEGLPVPPGRGVTVRMAGTHLYASAIPEIDPREIGARAGRMAVNLPAFLQNYEQIWAAGRDELEATWAYFQNLDLKSVPQGDFASVLTSARRYHKRSMEIHFDVMYPMLLNFLGFYGACAEMGLDPSATGKFLQGEDTKIMETDRGLAALAIKAKQAGLRDVFEEHDGGSLRAALSARGGSASTWLTEFDDFLQVFGHRQEATCDVGVPSWLEDNTIPLDMIRSFALKDGDHDFEAAARNAIAEREASIDAARSGLTKEEQAIFDAGLQANQAANFPWWQDDHNYYIDLKVMLPLRRACQELAGRVGADDQNDMLYLFWPELVDVANGAAYAGELKSLVADRRQYFDHWHAKRGEMPKVLGTIPEKVEDPILIEIFGLNPQSIRAVQNPNAANETVLTGVAAAKGTATGIARVLQSTDEMYRLEPGTILVCESTSPTWTPAFGKIAGAVCDGGGMLSHAAIVGREYGVPTVTAVGIATLAIGDGDLIEVDGTNGSVTILKKAE